MYLSIKAVLSKSGIAENMTKDARDGPLQSGGTGVLSLFHYQVNSRAIMMIEQYNRQTPTEKS